LYETRHIQPENLQKSEALLQQVLRDEPGNAKAHAELSRVCFLTGDAAEKKDEKIAWYQKGEGYGKKAIALDPRSPWAHLWRAVNLGRIGQVKGVMNSLFMVPEIRKEVEKALELNPGMPGALDVRAVINYELPGLFGGNLSKSIEDLEKAIAMDPNYTILYVDMGEAYLRKKEYSRAREYLQKALRIEKPTYEADYVLKDRPRAERLLQKIGNK
ncbi:MAG: tetratricopeptide repeat protein, partial [Endomicrobiales bacterium]